jgi:GTP-binding protein
MVDGKIGVDQEDKKLFYELQKINANIALIVNKIDNEKEAIEAWEFEKFGAKNIFFVSMAHNIGVAKLFAWLEPQLEESEIIEDELIADDDDFDDMFDDETEEEVPEHDPENDPIRVAIIGRVNVGKSSLLNGLVGHQRSVTSSIAGTTIDPVDEKIDYENREITFIDTAGIRKRSKIVGIEKWALDRSQKVLEKADIALLVLDGSEEFKELDERVAGYIDKYKTGCIIVLNKWDAKLHSYEEAVAQIRDKFKFLYFAPILTVSATTGKRLPRILDEIIKVYGQHARKIPTKKLNDCIKEATGKHRVPSHYGRIVRIKYAVQYQTKPIKISLVMNIKEIHFSYERYLINQLREAFGLEGAPVLLSPRKRGERDETDDYEDERQ